MYFQREFARSAIESIDLGHPISVDEQPFDEVW